MRGTDMTYQGKRFDVQRLGEGTWSVRCLDDPDLSEDGIDYTEWPEDDLVSAWCGVSVTFQDSGDDPDYVEAIFYEVSHA